MKFEGQLYKLENFLVLFYSLFFNAHFYNFETEWRYYNGILELLDPAHSLNTESAADDLSHDIFSQKGIKISPLRNAFLTYVVLQPASPPYSKEACEFLRGSLEPSDSNVINIKEIVISQEDANKLLAQLRDIKMVDLFNRCRLSNVRSALVEKLQKYCHKPGWFGQ
jgi:hypothetical protein